MITNRKSLQRGTKFLSLAIPELILAEEMADYKPRQLGQSIARGTGGPVRPVP